MDINYKKNKKFKKKYIIQEKLKSEQFKKMTNSMVTTAHFRMEFNIPKNKTYSKLFDKYFDSDLILLSVLFLVLLKYTQSKQLIIGVKKKGNQYLENNVLVEEGFMERSFCDFKNEIKLKLENAIIFTPTNSNKEIDMYFEAITTNGVKYDIQNSFIAFKSKTDIGIKLNVNKIHKTKFQNFATHYINALKSVLLNDNVKLSLVEIIPTEERKLILEDFSKGRIKELKHSHFIDAFERTVNKNPSNKAITYNNEFISYKGLNEKANQLARYFIDKGLNANENYAVIIDRSPLLIITLIALWKIKAAYIPIDPSYPQQRQLQILEESKVDVAISAKKIEFKSSIKTLYVDCILPNIKHYNSDNLDLEYRSSDTAYVIFTSGSTGKPKGAIIEHLGMMNHMDAMIDEFYLNDKSNIAQTASQSFDISVWQMFTSLIIGARTTIFSNVKLLRIKNLIADLNNYDITILEVVPSYLSLMIETLNRNFIPLNNLDYLIVTGDILSADLLNRWFNLYPNIKIANAYGPAEASDDVTLQFYDKALNNMKVTLGKPIQNTNIYIVDQLMNLSPIGVPGEIVVSGICVGKGYLFDVVKTREKFLSKNIFENLKNERMYRTGDIGYWNDQGEIAFMGRSDFQVKIRGHRVEISEIENSLLKIESLKEAVVVLKKINGRQYLCCYYTSRIFIETDSITSFIKTQLPSYMIPEQFIELSEIPLSPNGKYDRVKLQNMELTYEQN